jgi:hypothetical protein
MSDTYDYSAHWVHLDGHDRGRNAASRLDGYHLDVRPSGDWPGHQGYPADHQHDSSGMRMVAGWIEELVGELTGSASGTPESVSKAGAPAFGPDSWAAARYLKASCAQVTGTVAAYAEDLVTNLRQAAKSIRDAADNYDAAERANVRSGQELQARSDALPEV